MKYQALLTVARDTISIGLGSWVIVREELSGHVHPELLYLAGLFIVGPGIIAGLSLLLGKGTTPSTPESSSRLQPPGVSSSSSS